jgi:hypothetical protein
MHPDILHPSDTMCISTFHMETYTKPVTKNLGDVFSSISSNISHNSSNIDDNGSTNMSQFDIFSQKCTNINNSSTINNNVNKNNTLNSNNNTSNQIISNQNNNNNNFKDTTNGTTYSQEDSYDPTPLYKLKVGIATSSEGIPCARNAGYLYVFYILDIKLILNYLY